MLFNALIIFVMGGASTLAFLIGLNQQIGAYFVLLLILSLLLFAPLPWVIYRTYALGRADYRLERDGLRLRWGLRAEDIPLSDVEWVRRSSDMAIDLARPPLSWPGAILGSVRAPDLGPVEYLASTTQGLLLIATTKKVYAISPEDPGAFMRSFQRSLELGSLTPISSSSVLPAAYLTTVWSDKAARTLLASGFLLTLLLFAGISLMIPGLGTASLGFYPNGAPLPPGPAEQLILLPILGAFLFVADLAAGLFFYRDDHYRLVAYIIWGSGVLTTILFILAVVFILFSGR